MNEAIVALITAVIGGFIGAYLNSHTDRQGRLFDRRSAVFGDFMTKINDAIENLSESVKDTDAISIADSEWANAVWRHFYPVYNAERVVRLFLSDKDREAFTKAWNQALQQINNFPRGHLTDLMPFKHINEIENIFLSNLTPEPFYESFFWKIKNSYRKIVRKRP